MKTQGTMKTRWINVYYMMVIIDVNT